MEGALETDQADSTVQPGKTGAMMLPTMQNQLRFIATVGLALGAVFGMAGTFVASDTLRSDFWALDGTALVVATVILALRYFRAGCDGIAAGFLVYAIGEAVMLTGTSLTPEAQRSGRRGCC